MDREVYVLERSWNPGIVIGSYFISVLGAYTCTQLFCQINATQRVWKKLSWIGVASVSFGGTGVWAMHFVSMLAMSIGIPVRYDIYMTLGSAAIAVAATFITFAYEILVKELDWVGWARRAWHFFPSLSYRLSHSDSDDGLPLLTGNETRDDGMSAVQAGEQRPGLMRRRTGGSAPDHNQDIPGTIHVAAGFTENNTRVTNIDTSATVNNLVSGEISDVTSASTSSTSLPGASGSDTFSGYSELGRDSYLGSQAAENERRAREEMIESLWGANTVVGRFIWALWFSLTSRVLTKGVLLGSTVCAMHYSGMWSMRMEGFIQWDMRLVLCSVFIAWAACIVAIVYMPMEPHFSQQMVFSLLAACSVSAMHYVGMASGTFYTTLPPPHTSRSVPSDLPLMILIVGTTTCLLSYAMLAHLVTQSRDRLAEMIMTKRTLWKVIAEREAFERANRLKSEFISVASHEIRTPLHAISGYTDLLLSTVLTEEQTTYLEAIRMGCHSIQLITNNVLDFSKLEKGSSESNARPVEVDMRSLALRVLHSCALPHRMSENLLKRLTSPNSDGNAQAGYEVSLYTEKNVELILLVDDTVPAVCYVDEVYVTRVVMNLISNALKFTEEGYVLVRFSLVPPKATNGGILGPYLCISVKDSGIGIPKELTEAIFEPFRQADTSLTRSHTGAGLGLAISRQLCARMGGTIDLESKQGLGSNFTARLPALSGKGEPVPILPPKSPPAQNIALSIAVRSRKTSELIRTLLEKRGFNIRAVDMRSSARVSQSALTKLDRLWVDIECLVATPWLHEYVLNIHTKVPRASCLIVCDEVGTDLGMKAMALLKQSGRIALVQRPIVLHDAVSALRSGIALSPSWTDPGSGYSSASHSRPGSSASSQQGLAVDTILSPPLIDPDRILSPNGDARRSIDLIRSQHSPDRIALQDQLNQELSRALDPLQSVVRDSRDLAAARARRVHFENKSQETLSPPAPLQAPDGTRAEASPPPKSLSQLDDSSVKSVEPVEKHCILLVEDNVVNQKLGIRLLQKLGYETELAENGKVALDLVNANRTKYALVLMDCQMPVMNGFECTRRIRGLESSGGKKGHLPVIALTANVSSESRDECRKAGADHFLPKPLLMDDLRETLSHYIGPDPPGQAMHVRAVR